MRKCSLQSFTEGLTIALFLGLLFVPLLGSFWGLDFYPYEGENRLLAQLPNLEKTPFSELPKALSNCANDHFGLRNTFIHGYNNFYSDVLHMKKGRVLEGLNDWLFLDENIKDYMGFRRLTDEQIAQITTSIVQRHAWIKEQGIPFLMVIPPNKIHVHGDMLPNVVPSPDALSRWKQVETALPPLNELNIIYLKDALIKARHELGDLYYRNDTHWKYEGGYAAYRVIVSELQRWFPAIKPISLDECDYTLAENAGDLPALLGKSHDYIRMDNKITPKNVSQITTEDYPVSAAKPWHTWPKNAFPSLTTNPQKTGRLLIFSDSFGYHVNAFLPQHFNQVAFFQMYASKANMKALIKEFKPDAILEIHLERMIDKFTETSYYLD